MISDISNAYNGWYFNSMCSTGKCFNTYITKLVHWFFKLLPGCVKWEFILLVEVWEPVDIFNPFSINFPLL